MIEITTRQLKLNSLYDLVAFFVLHTNKGPTALLKQYMLNFTILKQIQIDLVKTSLFKCFLCVKVNFLLAFH